MPELCKWPTTLSTVFCKQPWEGDFSNWVFWHPESYSDTPQLFVGSLLCRLQGCEDSAGNETQFLLLWAYGLEETKVLNHPIHSIVSVLSTAKKLRCCNWAGAWPWSLLEGQRRLSSGRDLGLSSEGSWEITWQKARGDTKKRRIQTEKTFAKVLRCRWAPDLWRNGRKTLLFHHSLLPHPAFFPL